MVMVHGDFICHTPDHNNRSKNKTFRSVLDTVIEYLDKHPSEAVIVTLKIDSGNQDTGRQALINILNQYTTRRPDRFYCWTGDPRGCAEPDDQSDAGAGAWQDRPDDPGGHEWSRRKQSLQLHGAGSHEMG